ncbi:unnamed protein product [Lactuca virosa]|uniref:Uncharacterized protein n=1 Tax=Lactuca virosa TaxID=75947 RepID=A0AAU9M2Z4_9ASTR|nr:unnamed protein product [Lactuca virosa]
MVAPHHTTDSTTTNEEDVSQPLMKIQTTNIHLVPYLDQYPNALRMLVQTFNNSVLSTTRSWSFSIRIEWLALAGSTVLFKKTTNMVSFQLSNSKTKKLTQKQFAQILKLPVSGTNYEVSNDQVLHMFNEMGHQPTLTGISHFKISSLPYMWSFFWYCATMLNRKKLWAPQIQA